MGSAVHQVHGGTVRALRMLGPEGPLTWSPVAPLQDPWVPEHCYVVKWFTMVGIVIPQH